MLAALWTAGITHDVPTGGLVMKRVEIPTYAFERKSFWVKPEANPNNPIPNLARTFPEP